MKRIMEKVNREVLFSIKKLLAFLMIYAIAAIILEIIIIGGYQILGYNVMQGQMPVGEWVERVPFYGMAGFALATLLYVTCIEKMNISDIGIRWEMKLVFYIVKGTVIGAAMVIVVIGILVLSGLGCYQGIGDISIASFFLWGLAYMIQSFTEEIMCRGFLQTTLEQRINPRIAIFLTSIVFMLPHISGILDIGGWGMVISIINVLLISWLLSIIKIREGSLGGCFGLHFGWNFCLGIIFGLGVSGGSRINGVFQIIVNPKYTIFTGGMYGIEASILVIFELMISIVVFSYLLRRKE